MMTKTAKAVESEVERRAGNCPNCGEAGLSAFYRVADVPVHSCLMMHTRAESMAFPRGDVDLAYCGHCGFVTNLSFDAKWSAYGPEYEDQQSFSPTFNRFAMDLADRLIAKYGLNGKDIVEIGCSKGDFLMLLCARGNNRGVGIDPSLVPGRASGDAADRVTFVGEYYDESHGRYPADFICCRHTLEHIQPTGEFLNTVRRAIGGRTATRVFFEVPDAGRVFRDLAFEDIYYEHCSYFTPGSLGRLFRASGFEILDLYTAYDDQYLLIEAKPAEAPPHRPHPLEETPEETARMIRRFAGEVDEKLDQWGNRVASKTTDRIAIWGSGSKCLAFATTLGCASQIGCVVDINPHRHGRYIPGIGVRIMPPEHLVRYAPDRVVVMNAIYMGEIRRMLDDMGVDCEIIAL